MALRKPDFATDWQTLKPGRTYTHAAGPDFKLIRIDESEMVIWVLGADKKQSISTEYMCKVYKFKDVTPK